jgi:hypothetical protein
MKFKLRPELGDYKYWIHIPIIVAVVYLLMILIKPISTVGFIVSSTIGVVLGDIIAHTLLRLK